MDVNNKFIGKRYEEYLYEMTARELDYEYAKNFFEHRYKPSGTGGCSSVRNGNFYGRDFDWDFSFDVSFVIRTPRMQGRYASIGMAGANSMLSKQFVESGEWYYGEDEDRVEPYKIIPFQMLDGINEKGVLANVNVVPVGEEGYIPTTGTNPSAAENICITMLVRYILDHSDTALGAVNSLSSINIYAPEGYEVHLMIADREHTYAVEFINNSIEASEISDRPYITNFYLHDTCVDEDGHIDYSTVTPHGQGLERYDIIADNYNSASDKEGMMLLMAEKLRCTKAYTWQTLDELWKTDYVGDYGERYGDLTVMTPKEEYQQSGILDVVKRKYQYRSRDRESQYFGTWQTVHTSVYDIEKRCLFLRTQEKNKEYVWWLDDKDEMNKAFGQFDGVEYFSEMARKNKLCVRNDFFVTKVSGIGYLEQMLENFRTHSNFIGVEDTTSEQIVSNGNGFFSSRIFTVYVIAGYDAKDIEDHNAKADLCKEIRRQFITKMLIDKEKFNDKLIFMNTNKIMGQGLGTLFLNGATGLFFQMEVSEPVELIYNDNQWLQEQT